MRAKKRRFLRRLMLVGLALPLFETTCVQITERSLINGFFDAATPFAADQLAQRATTFFEHRFPHDSTDP